MAKRRRLNRRFVILLASIGALLALFAVTIFIWSRPVDADRVAQRAAKRLAEGDYAQAVRDYSRAAEESRKPEHYLALGNAMLRWWEEDASLPEGTKRRLLGEARSAFKEAVRWSPRNEYVEAQRKLLEMALWFRDNWENVAEEADRLLKMVPDDHGVLFERARAKDAMGQTRPEYIKPAMEDYRKLLEIAPQEDRYWQALAAFHARREQQGQPKEPLWKCSNHPQIRRAQKGTCPICGKDLVSMTAGAEQTYKDALKAIDDSVAIRVDYSSYILRQDKARKAEALKLLAEAVEKQPKNVEGHLALADYHFREKETDEAIRRLQQAISVDPADHRLYARLAYAHTRHRDDPTETEAVLLKGLAEIRKSLDESGSASDQALEKYRYGILALNHMLSDALLDRLAQGGAREQILPRAREALQEMQGVSQRHPLIEKITGRIAMAEGQFVRAEEHLRRAYEAFGMQFEPKTAQLLIDVYRRLNQLGEAQKIIERYRSVSEDQPALLLNLVDYYLRYRDYGRAERLVQGILKLEPEHELAQALSVALEAVAGKRDRIPPEMAELNGFVARLFLQRAQDLWVEGEEVKAIRLAADVVARDARHRRATLQLLGWLKERKDAAQFDAVLERATAAFKDDPETQQQLALMRETDPDKRMAHQLTMAEKIADPVQQALARSDIYRAYGKETDSLEQLKAAEAKDPKHTLVVHRLFDHHFSKSDWAAAEKYAKIAAENNLDSVGGKFFQARLARGRGDWEGARRLISEAIKMRSRFSEAHSFRGDCYLAQERVEEARADYEAAYEQNPSNVRALLGMVAVSERLGTSQEYSRWVTLAYRFVPNDPTVRERFVQLREAEDEPEKAIQRRERIRKADPNDLRNLTRLARLYEKADNLAKAEEAYKATYRLSRGAPQALRALAGFLRRTDRDLAARGLLTDHIEQASDKVTAYLLWADYLELSGKTDEARAAYQQAVDADKDGRGYAGMAGFVERQGDFAQAAQYQEKLLERAGASANLPMVRRLIWYQIEAGQHKQAEQRIAEMLGKDPADYGALALKGLAHFEQHDLVKAKQALDRSIEINPEYATALWYRARVHQASGRKSLAAKDLTEARRTGGRTSIWVSFQLAELYSSMNDFANADAVLQSLLAERPDYAPALRARATLCLRHKRWPLLETVLAEAKKLFPTDPFFPDREVQMWRVRGEPARAVAPLEQAVKLSPPEQQASMGVLLGQVLTEAGMYDQALQVCKRLEPAKDVAPLVRSIEARVYAVRNNHAEAEKRFLAALKTASDREQLSYVIAQLRQAYAPATAIANMKRWVVLQPDEWLLPYSLGEMLAAAQDRQGAARQFEQALAKARTDQDKWQVHRQLGIVYDHLGRYVDCRRVYEAALGFEPNDGITLNNLAWLIAHHLKKPQEALPYATRATELMPENPYVIDTLGLVLMQTGDLPKAEEQLNRSIAIMAIPANRLHLGMVYEKLKRTKDALRQYRLGWELIKDKPKDVHYDELRDAVKRLGGTP